MAINVNKVISAVTEKVEVEAKEILGFSIVSKVLVVNVSVEIVKAFEIPLAISASNEKINLVYNEFILAFPLGTLLIFGERSENDNRD